MLSDELKKYTQQKWYISNGEYLFNIGKGYTSYMRILVRADCRASLARFYYSLITTKTVKI